MQFDYNYIVNYIVINGYIKEVYNRTLYLYICITPRNICTSLDMFSCFHSNHSCISWGLVSPFHWIMCLTSVKCHDYNQGVSNIQVSCLFVSYDTFRNQRIVTLPLFPVHQFPVSLCCTRFESIRLWIASSRIISTSLMVLVEVTPTNYFWKAHPLRQDGQSSSV